ncbi:MAG: hypothetical protein AB8F78_15860 [Saprospiraceae bacterium]
MRIPYLFLSIFLFAFVSSSLAQGSEYFMNPSFEDTSSVGKAPRGWFDCNFSDESPVDVHDSKSEFFGVMETAADGQSFVGMVTRDNNTYEGISTRLLKPLQADSTYRLTVKLKQSPVYTSILHRSSDPINYLSPVRFKIWGGSSYCNQAILLEEYDAEQVEIWTELTFYINPEIKIPFIGLYATHPASRYDNGHILIDDLQLVKVDPFTLEER